MNKKTAVVVIALLLGAIAAFCFLQWKGEGSFNALVISNDAAKEIMAARTNAETIQPDIFFDEEKLIYDDGDGLYYYSLVEDDKNAYNPSVQVKTSKGNLKIAFVDSSITDELIASNGRIKVLLYDDEKYCEKDLVCTTLPMISLNSESEFGDIDVEAVVSVFDNEKASSQRNLSSDALVRYRGNTTKVFPKKSFKISLKTESVGGHSRDNDISMLGMRKDEDWILTACYNDSDRVRNLFSANLWKNSCGLDNAYGVQTGNEYRFVELFVNGRYWGLYTLGYKPDAKTMGVDVSAEGEDIYIKEDYLLSGFRADSDLKPIQDYYCRLGENADDNDYLKSIVDMDNIIDFNLFVTLIQGTDNLQKNYYVLLQDHGDGKRAIYVPWDLDRSWGDEWSPYEKNETLYYDLRAEDNVIFTENALYQLLFNNDEETWDMVFKKYAALRRQVWSDVVIGDMLDECDADIFGSGAYLREKSRWPGADYNDTDSLDTFREFVFGRLHEMDDLMDNLKSYRLENPYITQCITNKHHEDSLFIIEVNEDWVLNDDKYSDFLHYLGIDFNPIAEYTRYILCGYGGENPVYISGTIEDGTEFETAYGFLRVSHDDEANYEYDEDCTVYLNDQKIFDSSFTDGDPLVVAAVYDGRVTKMNMDDGYKVRFDMDYTQDPEIIMSLMDNMGGYALLQINNLDNPLIDKKRLLKQYDIDFGSYENMDNAFESCNELVFLIDNDRRNGYLMEDPYMPSSIHDTPIGQYAFFAGDTDYGIYLNGEDGQTGSLDSIYDNDIVITVFSKDYTSQIRKYEF